VVCNWILTVAQNFRKSKSVRTLILNCYCRPYSYIPLMLFAHITWTTTSEQLAKHGPYSRFCSHADCSNVPVFENRSQTTTVRIAFAWSCNRPNAHKQSPVHFAFQKTIPGSIFRWQVLTPQLYPQTSDSHPGDFSSSCMSHWGRPGSGA